MSEAPTHDSTDNGRVAEPATTPAAQFLEKIKDHCFDPAHDYFGRTHAMAAQAQPSNERRPGGPSRARTAVENLLPAGIVRRGKSRPAPSPSPHLERSTSSMADSFVDYWGVCSRNPDLEGSLTPAIQEDGLTPISNWAHLNYMKAQRNTLRTELKTHQIAGAEAKRSVASLRRLAFRMAVNISVKERQIAASARNLLKTRTSNYLDGRDAEKRVDALKRALRVEEGRNKEILEALERASMLTLQYASPTDAQLRRPRNPLSPPPSPPTRLSNLSMTIMSDPRTPPRSTSSSWHDTDWELTPSIESPTEVRTSDSRLIRAKRESDQALSACLRRINELQAECTKSKENGKTLEASKSNLEKEIEDQQSRMAALEQAKIAVEETLESTKLQLEVSTSLEEGLKQKLRMKNKELASLEQSGKTRLGEFTTLENERARLSEQLQDRNTRLERLEVQTTVLQNSLKNLGEDFNVAQHEESSLRDQLKEKEAMEVELNKRIDRGSKYEQILQKKLAESEQEILGNFKKLEVGGGLIASLREQVKLSECNKKNTEDALATLRTEVTTLEASRAMKFQEHDLLAQKLSAVQTTKTRMEEELQATEKALAKEQSEKIQVQSDLKTLWASHDALGVSLQAAHDQIHSLERVDAELQAEFELLQDEKSAIEADLKDARQTLFTLREAERMSQAGLRELESSVKSLQQALHKSKERESVLENDLAQARMTQAAADRFWKDESQRHAEQHRELQLSVTSLHASLEASEKLKASLQAELHQFQASKDVLDERLIETVRLKIGLQTELDTVRSSLEHNASEMGNLTNKITELEAHLNASQQSQAKVEARLSAVHDEREILTMRVSELEFSLQENRVAKCNVEERLRTSQVENQASVEKIANLHDRLSKSQESKEEVDNSLSDAVATRTDLENQLQSARSRLSELETETSHTRSELSTLQGNIAQAHRSKTEVEERSQTLQNAHDELKTRSQSTQSRLEAVESEVTVLELKLADSKSELEKSHNSRAELEKMLEEASKSHAEIEKELGAAKQYQADAEMLRFDLSSARSLLTELRVDNSKVCTKLHNAEEEISTLQQSKTDVEGKLHVALASTATLQQDLETTRAQLHDFESRHATLISRISVTDQELAMVRDQKSEVEQQSESKSTDLSSIRLLLDTLESKKANMVKEALRAEKDISSLRENNVGLETKLGNVSQRTLELENDLRIARTRLATAESGSIDLESRILRTDKNLDILRQANKELTTSEKDLQGRLASAVHDLHIVEDTNKRLEAFLHRVEEDMAHAETAFEESEKRLEEFIGESQSKLDAARNSKLEYKRKLSERNNEVEILTNQNSDLQNQIGERTQELSAVTKGKEEMAEQLLEKEKFVDELRLSSDERMKSMNFAYNELRSEYEQRQGQHDAATRRKSLHDGEESNLSFANLEQEVQALREDKKAFQQLVVTLEGKIRHLQTLEEWHEPTEIPSKAGPPMAELDSVPSRPTTQHTGSSRPESVISRPTSTSHRSLRNERPTTRASTASKQADLDAWATEVERIRTLRNEQAVQLRDNKKARSDLRKSLRESKTQLHQLERQSKPTRHRALLKKNRPSTALLTATDPDQSNPAPNSPSRPATSYTPHTSHGGTARSRHTIHFSPSTFDSVNRPNTSTPLSMSSRWSTPHRPKSSHRPATSGALGDGAGKRPMTSAGDGIGSEAKEKEKKRWSSSLKKLFK